MVVSNDDDDDESLFFMMITLFFNYLIFAVNCLFHLHSVNISTPKPS